MKIFLGIVGGFFVFVGAIILMVFMGTSGIKKAAEQTLTDMHNGNIQKVYDQSAFVGQLPFQRFNAALGEGSPFDITTAEKISWQGRGFKNNEKYIYGKFKFADGSEVVVTFSYVQKDGKYVLDGITRGAPKTNTSDSNEKPEPEGDD